jgi:hypothetical protein
MSALVIIIDEYALRAHMLRLRKRPTSVRKAR